MKRNEEKIVPTPMKPSMTFAFEELLYMFDTQDFFDYMKRMNILEQEIDDFIKAFKKYSLEFERAIEGTREIPLDRPSNPIKKDINELKKAQKIIEKHGLIAINLEDAKQAHPATELMSKTIAHIGMYIQGLELILQHLNDKQKLFANPWYMSDAYKENIVPDKNSFIDLRKKSLHEIYNEFPHIDKDHLENFFDDFFAPYLQIHRRTAK